VAGGGDEGCPHAKHPRVRYTNKTVSSILRKISLV
jgi:hypothetical protein